MRDAPRLHVEEALGHGVEIAPDADRLHYLLHVMRGRDGDPVRVFNAACGEWEARIRLVGRKGAVLEVGARVRAPLAGGAGPALLFAPLKRDATDLVVRMATELGAGSLRPVLTERTVAGRVNLERLGSIAREAAEQCERLDVPAIFSPARLDAVLGGWPAGVVLACAVERSTGERAAGAGARGADAEGAPGAILVGPEGGFSPAELDLLRSRSFVRTVSLGSLVLRAETAAAAALALLGAGLWQPATEQPARPGENDVQSR